MNDENTPQSCGLSGHILFIFCLLINGHLFFSNPISNEFYYILIEQGPKAERFVNMKCWKLILKYNNLRLWLYLQGKVFKKADAYLIGIINNKTCNIGLLLDIPIRDYCIGK